jgi:acyl dehydratase
MRFFEDLVVGERRRIGSYVMVKEEMVAFAKQFDPQPFHTDEEAAKASWFGGLVASGWHTASIAMRIMVVGFIGDFASMGSPGVDELRWLKPVRPGDTLTLDTELIEAQPSKSKNDRGYVRLLHEMTNQHGEKVMSMIGRGIVARRSPA